MEPTPQPQISLAMMLVLVACIAVNFWLFRVSVFWGLVAINITKHVSIAALCQVLGVNRKLEEPVSEAGPLPGRVATEPSAN